jgi:PAS domain S-box-containing protein
MHPLLQRQIKKSIGGAEPVSTGVQDLLQMVSDAYEAHDSDRLMLEYSMEISSRELFEQNKKLAAAETKYRSIFENATEGIFQVSTSGRYISANPALAMILGYDSVKDLMSVVADIGADVYVQPGRWKEIVGQLEAKGDVARFESQAKRKDGTVIWISDTLRMAHDDGRISHYEGTTRDITARRKAEEERHEMQSRVVALSRQAGMADIASSVLHNVGNVLNSLNVSVSIATSRIQQSPVEHLIKVAQLLNSHHEDLAAFLTCDDRGRRIPDFIASTAGVLADEQEFLLEEMTRLARNVDHIKRVIHLQQDYAKPVQVKEEVSLEQLIEDALNVDSAAFDKLRIKIVRDFRFNGRIKTDKHIVLQILLNLVSNARHALVANGRDEKTLTIRTFADQTEQENFFVSQVQDNGVGIKPEVLSRIFTHGFTTKPEGHGFGLHSSANFAKFLGGSLTAASEGAGCGATFTLKLPAKYEPAVT